MDEILNNKELPIKYAGYSPCFRREAGSHGKDTRGIFRVHWFDKVEMFVFANTEDADSIHKQLLEVEKEVLTKLELPFRVIGKTKFNIIDFGKRIFIVSSILLEN